MSFHWLNIGDLMGALALWNDFQKARTEKGGGGEKFPDFIRQRLPGMFGFGRTDERLFESLRQFLDAGIRHLIDLVIGEMQDYEADLFRLTITGMPCGSELTDDLVKDPKKGQPPTVKKTVSWEMTKEDLRVKYLTGIANEVSRRIAAGHSEQSAAHEVVVDMRSRRLITRSPAAQKAYELWIGATEWTKKNILDFFGVGSFGELTDTIMAKKINEAADNIPRQPGDLSLNPFKGIGATFRKLFS